MNKPDHIVFAGFWIRLMADILDSFIIGIPVSFAITMYYSDTWSFLGYTQHPFAVFALSIFTTVAFWLTWNGQTPGKKMMGIRIVSYPNFGDLNAGAAWIRCVIGYTVSAVILCFGFLMIAFRKDKRGLHDMISGTCVIQVQETTKPVKAQKMPNDWKVYESHRSISKSDSSNSIFSLSNIIIYILIIILINILFNFNNVEKLLN